MIIGRTVRLTREEDSDLRSTLRNVLRWWGPEIDDTGRKRIECLAKGDRVDLQKLADAQEWLVELREWAERDIDTYTPGIDSNAMTPFGSEAVMSLSIVESRVQALKDIKEAEVALAEVMIEAFGKAAP